MRKVCVVSLPKSGSVWLLSLLADCLGLEIVHPQEMSSRQSSCVTKCHRRYEDVFSIGSNALLYLVRDPRDAFVSYFHYQKTTYYTQHNKDYTPFEDMHAYYREYYLPVLLQGKGYPSHFLPYKEHGVYCVRYEDLCLDAQKVLADYFTAQSEPLENSRIASAVAKNDFSVAQKNGIQLWEHIPSTHFRKGTSGRHKKELPQDLADELTDKYGQFIKTFGYAS